MWLTSSSVDFLELVADPLELRVLLSHALHHDLILHDGLLEPFIRVGDSGLYLSLLLLEHGLLGRVDIDLLQKILCLSLQLLYLLLDLTNVRVGISQLAVLRSNLSSKVVSCVGYAILPLARLPECVFYRQVLGVDEVARVLDHVSNEKLAVAELADLAPILLSIAFFVVAVFRCPQQIIWIPMKHS